MSLVVNKIAACENTNHKILVRSAVKLVVLHRTDLHILDPVANPHPIPDELLDGPALAARFKNTGLGTAGLTPYHFLIRANAPDFTVEQLIPLSIRGAHAVGYNWQSYGIACVGDFRKHPVPEGMWLHLCQLVAALIPLKLDVAGHTDLPGASADPNKVCPGAFLSSKLALAQASNMLPADWKTWDMARVDSHLVESGIVV